MVVGLDRLSHRRWLRGELVTDGEQCFDGLAFLTVDRELQGVGVDGVPSGVDLFGDEAVGVRHGQMRIETGRLLDSWVEARVVRPRGQLGDAAHVAAEDVQRQVERFGDPHATGDDIGDVVGEVGVPVAECVTDAFDGGAFVGRLLFEAGSMGVHGGSHRVGEQQRAHQAGELVVVEQIEIGGSSVQLVAHGVDEPGGAGVEELVERKPAVGVGIDRVRLRLDDVGDDLPVGPIGDELALLLVLDGFDGVLERVGET